MGPILSSNNNANIQHIWPSSNTMPIPPTLEIVDLSNGSVVHVFRIPVGVIGEPAASSFVLGRKELIDWFGPFEGSDKVSRKSHFERDLYLQDHQVVALS